MSMVPVAASVTNISGWSSIGTTMDAPTPAAATMPALLSVARRPRWLALRVDRGTIELWAV